jgi:hypothetical protein
MPRAARRKSEIDPDGIYICWMSGSAEVDGQTVSFHEGERLRGDSPAVQGCDPPGIGRSGSLVNRRWFARQGASHAGRLGPPKTKDWPRRNPVRL